MPYEDQFGGMNQGIKTIFGVPALPTVPTNPAISNLEEESELDALRKIYDEIYKPEHQYSEMYRQGISEMPVRQQPGKLAKVAGSLAGLKGGPKAADDIMYGSYNRELADWTARMRPIEQSAQFEQSSNSNLRILANQMLTQERANRNLERMYGRDAELARAAGVRETETARRNQETERQGRERIEIQRAVANGGWLDIDDAGNGRIVFKDGTEKPIKGDYLSFEEKEHYRALSAGARAAAVAANQRDRVQVRAVEVPPGSGNWQYVVVNLDANTAAPVTVTPPPAPKQGEQPAVAPPPPAALEETRDITNNAMQAKNAHPEWSKWIKFDKSNRFTGIENPGMFSEPGGVPSSKPSQAEYAAMYQAIYGTQPPNAPQAPPARVGGPPPANTTAGKSPGTVPPEGTILVINPQGQRGRIPVTQWPAAEKQGYKKVTP